MPRNNDSYKTPHKPNRPSRQQKAAARQNIRNSTKGGSTVQRKAARNWREMVSA